MIIASQAQDAADRIAAAIALIRSMDADEVSEAYEAQIITVAADRELWRTGEPPLAFDAFCVALDTCPLFPRQLKVFVDCDMIDPKCWVTHGRRIQEIVLTWGKGSTVGSTLLRDEVTGITRSAEDWCRSGESLSVKSLLNGRVVALPASPVFCKGEANTWEVTFADGRSVGVSADHRFLTEKGWKKASEISTLTDKVLCLPKIGAGPYTQQREDGCGQTRQLAPSFLGDCPISGHSCDELVRLVEGPGQYGPPSPHHALASCLCAPSDCLPASPSCTSPCQWDATQEPKNFEAAYRPLVHAASGEQFPLGFDIPEQVQSALDLYCSLPQAEKLELLADFSFLENAPNESEWQSRFLSFGQRVSQRIRRQEARCLSGEAPENTAGELAPYQFVSSEYSFQSVVSIVPQTRTKIYDLTVPVAHCYFDAQGILHHNSGKDYLAAKVTCYVAYIIQSLRKDPATYYRVAPYSTLSIINVAPTEKQARTIFFRYLSGFLRSAVMKPFVPNPRRQIMADTIKFYRITLDGAEYEPVVIESMHSRAASLEGKNVIWWTMDEADAFLDSGDKSNADEVHDILRSSASTRFSGFWGGMVISYPRVAEGFLMRLMDRAQLSPTFYADLAPTWEVNPRFNRNAPEVESDYQANPSHARALYECIPQATLDGFFEFPERVELATDPLSEPCAVVTEEPFEAKNGESILRFVTVKMHGFTRTPGHTYFMGGDAGVKNDAYALAIFHTEDGLEAPPYLCKNCIADDPEPLRYGRYIQQPINTVIPFDERITCPFCFRDPIEAYTQAEHTSSNTTVRIDGWWVRSDLHRDGQGPVAHVVNGASVALPHVYEDLIVRVKPFHATRQGEVNRVVYLPGIQQLAIDLTKALGIRSARFDPHAAQQLVQTLQSGSECDAGEISFSNTEQLRRGRLVKAMLYAGKITLLPNKGRDREWKRLQLVGAGKIDHPEGGEKDVWDAESVAIWQAATSSNSQLAISFI